MICPKCGHENDEDAIYCEKCGKNLKKTSGTLGNQTKLLIGLCVVLILIAGVTAGVLMKNSQNTSKANEGSDVSKDQISEGTGFPVSLAPDLASEIEKQNGTFETIKYGSVSLDKYQCIYILSKATVMLNKNESGNITIKSVGAPDSPYGFVSTGSLSKDKYVDVAYRTYNWINTNGIAPNYVGISNPGQPDLSPDTILSVLSDVLSQYKSTGKLPETVAI
ncbi:pseudomurein-binding repeat-containing protein [Methanobacterium congolense]|uniref:Pseudomurein-binding repeat-containing protein n=1 Tax=Methanobacterium congolense TaxID=118062 RepID=A0A1D3L196_9EURY|nr:pseudomurein-binding repeat-containing protein [Methanobacterium congolense]SCG85444.1 Pseudomurein-binding repeat-containing protein [Methanobacterium congolense]